MPDGVFPLGVRIFDQYLHPGPHKGNSEFEFNYYIAQPTNVIHVHDGDNGAAASEASSGPCDMWEVASSQAVESMCSDDVPTQEEVQQQVSYDPMDFTRFQGKVLIMLHLCAGQRRFGDLQSQVEWMGHYYQMTVCMLSLDVAIDPVRGNLCSNQTIRFWVRCCHAGKVIAFFGGPPCESWSAIRAAPVEKLQPGKPPPRPLRSANNLWGLPGLSFCEYRQVDTGNRLLQAFLEIAWAVYRSGGVGVLEHPEDLAWRTGDHPSIWRTTAIRSLKECDAIDGVSFDQCITGQIAKKPTHLLLIRASRVKDILMRFGNKGRCNHPDTYDPQTGERIPAHPPLKGIDPTTGTWRTRPAKQHTPVLCAALAGGVLQTIRSAKGFMASDHLSVDQIPDEFRVFVQSFDPYQVGVCSGPALHTDFFAGAAGAFGE